MTESTEERLWDLADKWRAEADDRIIYLPFLSDHPRTARAQGLNGAAEDLSDLLLLLEDEANNTKGE